MIGCGFRFYYSGSGSDNMICVSRWSAGCGNWWYMTFCRAWLQGYDVAYEKMSKYIKMISNRASWLLHATHLRKCESLDGSTICMTKPRTHSKFQSYKYLSWCDCLVLVMSCRITRWHSVLKQMTWKRLTFKAFPLKRITTKCVSLALDNYFFCV